MDIEQQDCPRRSEGPEIFPGPDKWETGRWDREGSSWPEGFDKPRNCSFCGCVHPEDALALIQSGWEISPTTKGYKAYIKPPGSNLAIKRTLKAIGDEKKMADISKVPKMDASPPLKLYTQHLTREQIDKLNALYREQVNGGRTHG